MCIRDSWNVGDMCRDQGTLRLCSSLTSLIFPVVSPGPLWCFCLKSPKPAIYGIFPGVDIKEYQPRAFFSPSSHCLTQSWLLISHFHLSKWLNCWICAVPVNCWSAFPFSCRKCALSGLPRTCKHRIMLGDSGNYYYISPSCRARVSPSPPQGALAFQNYSVPCNGRVLEGQPWNWKTVGFEVIPEVEVALCWGLGGRSSSSFCFQITFSVFTSHDFIQYRAFIVWLYCYLIPPCKTRWFSALWKLLLFQSDLCLAVGTNCPFCGEEGEGGSFVNVAVGALVQWRI